MRKFLAVAVIALVSACATTGAVFGPSQEARIKTGADSHKASTVVATTLLKNRVISLRQAKNYQTLLQTSSDMLDDSFERLEKCRIATKSNEKTKPDPCEASVIDDINLGLQTIAEVKKALDARGK